MSNSAEVSAVTEALSRVFSENESLKESLADVKMMLDAEDRNWTLFGSYLTGEKLEGFDLDELKEVSEKLRRYTTGNALMRHGCALHTGYVFSNGFFIEGTDSPQGSGRPSNLRQMFIKRINQESMFSYAAQAELQKARYTDGMVLLLCDKSKNTVRRIPLSEITGVQVDEDFGEDVIAYQRTWKSYDKDKVQKRWYMTDRFEGKRPKSFGTGDDLVPVDPTLTLVDGRFNRAVGFVLGVPDAIAAGVYISAYDQILQYGRVVDESLSRILYKIVNKTKAGVQASAVKISNTDTHGGAASLVEGQDIQALGGSRTNFNFSNARPVAAMAAAALDVSNIDLLSDSSAAGSSYGSGNLLTIGVRNAMRQKQNEWIDIFHRVLDTLGLGRPRIFFEKMEEIEPYRAAQALVLLSPTLSDEEYRMKSLDILDVLGNADDIPPLLKARNAVSTDTSNANAGVQAASPDQGVSNGTGTSQSGGGGQGANDLRSDLVGESLRKEMALESLIERFESIAARLDAQSN